MKVRKTLSANDLGLTNSHQAGIHVPKEVAFNYFPRLDPHQLNPDLWLHARDEQQREWIWRFVHYNGATLGTGTRDEFRITRIREYLKEGGACRGDELEFEFLSGIVVRVRLLRKPEEKTSASDAVSDDEIVVDLRGGWKSARWRR